MNGTLTYTWRGRATRSHTIFSLRHGGRLEVTNGELFDVAEDHYGNTYVYDASGIEFPLVDLEPVEAPPHEWNPDGLRERIEHLTAILDREVRPVEGAYRAELEARRESAARTLERVAGRAENGSRPRG
jgi:hypothetical protein